MAERPISVAEVPPEVAGATDDQPILLYPDVQERKDDVTLAVEAVQAADGVLADEKPKAPPKPKAEKPKVEPAEDEKRLGSLANSLRQREKALVEKQQTFTRQREEFDRFRTTTTAQLEQHQRMTAMAAQDPITWLERAHGFTREDIAARLVTGRARPEEAQGAQAREIADLREQIKKDREARQAEQAESNKDRELTKFVTEARAGDERWPHAAKWNEAKLRAKAWELALENTRKGVRVSNEDILDAIEEDLAEIAALRQPATPAPKPKPSPARPARPTAERQPTAPTLTSRGAGAQSTDEDDEADLPTLTEEERTERMLRAMSRAAQNGVAMR